MHALKRTQGWPVSLSACNTVGVQRVTLITNEASGSADKKARVDIVAALGALGSVEILEPSSLEAFDEEVRTATSGASFVVVGGGDGTMNQTLNALGDRLGEHTFCLLPMGTGNDLARTLDLPRDPSEVAHALAGWQERTLDVSVAAGSGAERLFANACLGGFSVEVDEELNPDLKKRVGPLAYWVAGAKVAARMPRATVSMNGQELTDCVAIGVGNGKTAGGGIAIWPDADPSDGLLDGCGISVQGVADAARVAVKLRSGEVQELDLTRCTRAHKIVVDSDDSVEFNVDGELAGLFTPATFEVVSELRIRVPGA